MEQSGRDAYALQEMLVQIKNYKHTGKILGLNITYNNFFRRHIDIITGRARAEIKKLKRFRGLKKALKLRLYKTLILPILLYPIIPINACSKSQINKLQLIQNAAIRWIYNENPPTRCPLKHRCNIIQPTDQMSTVWL